MKTQLSSLDINFLVRELSGLAGARIDNFYQIGERDLKITMRAAEKKELIITPKYLCLTKFEHKVPDKPSNFAMLLRKHLGGGIIKSIEQHRFDRIVEITIEGRGKLIIELFSRGNIIFLDEQNNIAMILESQEWKDRTLKFSQPYAYPPETPDVKALQLSDLVVMLSEDKEIVRILATDLGLGATYANEVLLRAGVEPTARADKEKAEKIYSALKKMLSENIHASIAVDKIPIDATPFALKYYEEDERIEKDSFNEAVDEYFTCIRTELEKGEATQDYTKDLERATAIIEKQKKTIEELQPDITRFKEKGDRVYANFQQIDSLLQGIRGAKSEGKNWIAFLEEKGIQAITPAERKFEFEGIDIFIDKPVSDNATAYYEKSKKARSKLQGALKALRESEAEILQIGKLKAKAESRLAAGPVEKHKPEWYEKFRWFVSSDGFLVIGGRDATTNEVILKKHLEPSDLVFHSAVHGAPFFVIKNPENKEIPMTTKKQTAEAAASYSSAWMDGIGSVDVYAVKPEQVSKTPGSGEYLPKGAFVLRGEREWFRGTPLKLALGFRISNYAIAICGPEDAIKSQTKYYGLIGVGDAKSGEIARQIKADILRKTNKEDGQKMKKVILGEIQRWIPAGKGMVLK